MASNGYISNQFRTGYKVQIYWVLNSQNVANNTSNITVHAQLVSTDSGYNISASAVKNGSLTINGTEYSFTFNATLSSNQTKTVYSKTLDITHGSDGVKSISVATTLGIAVTLSGTYYGNVSTNGTISLNTIPRGSSISLNTTNGTLGSTKFVVTINRASTSFTHKVYYRFGSINVLINGTATTTAEFTPALGDSAQIPNATSGTGSVVVETYNGSTLVGTVSSSITLQIPSSVVPTITGLTATLVPDGAAASYGYVKGKSKCKLSITGASGTYQSSIKSYHISGGGFTGTSVDYTTGALTTSGTVTFTAYITDSRGRQSASKTVSISVLDYTIPNITGFSVIRCFSNGIANDDGTYLKLIPTYTYSSMGGSNSVTSSATYKATDTSVWTSAGAISSGVTKIVGSGGISTSKSYDVKFSVADNFTSVSRSVLIPSAFVTLDFKNGGKGIAIGKAAEYNDLFDINMNVRLQDSKSILKHHQSATWLNGARGSGAAIYMDTYGAYNSYSPLLTQKAYDGVWTFGAYGSDNWSMAYLTDTNVNNGNNTVLSRYDFQPESGTWKVLGISGTTLNSTGLLIDSQATTSGTSKGLTIKGSGGPVMNLWCGSGGAVICTTNAYNLHFGYNGNTTDMSFYANEIITNKKLITAGQLQSDTLHYDTRSSGFDGGWGIGVYSHLYPTTTNRSLGTAAHRWQILNCVSNPNVSSDVRLKEDILYISDSINKDRVVKPRIENLTTYDFLEFIRDQLQITSFNYKIDLPEDIHEDEKTQIEDMRKLQIGFIAQDIEDTKVGNYIVTKDTEGMLGYEVGNYTSVIAGALQEEIRIRDKEITTLTKRIDILETKLESLIK